MEDVPGCRGKGESGASYCINPRCKLGYCVYNDMPKALEAMPAYMFAQMRCCRVAHGDREEYCNRVGYLRINCPPDKIEQEGPGYPDGGCEKFCADGCHDCHRMCGKTGESPLKVKWCCNAKENGPPVWWLRINFVQRLDMTLDRVPTNPHKNIVQLADKCSVYPYLTTY
jgi:hypothetical protein